MLSTYAGVREWLLGGALPSVQEIRDARIGAFAYSTLAPGHASRDALRADYAGSVCRHRLITRELLPLLRAWRERGIDILLFKGFQLSEFVYPLTGTRFHGDVDILFRPDQLRRAENVAIAMGWRSARPLVHRLRPRHNAFALRGRSFGSATVIDAHRMSLEVRLPWHPVQRRITEALWHDAGTRRWHGLDVREPSPVDMLLVGLMLQRCWGTDQWQLKPHDFVDFKAISSRYDLTRDDLRARAGELGCERTLDRFLIRCDPEANVLELGPLDARSRRRLNYSVMRERGPLGSEELFLARLISLPLWLPSLLRFLPTALRVRLALARHGDLRSLLGALTTQPVATVRRRMSLEQLVTGVRWATRFVGGSGRGSCLVRALTTYVAMREQGWSVTFVSGVRRTASSITGHAWVECDGELVAGSDRPDICASFTRNFQFPERAPGRPSPVPGSGAAMSGKTAASARGTRLRSV